LASALEKLPPINDPRVLVGFNTADDAGVIKITDDLALVQTVDIFTPIVDDPYQYGLIAAANALSDVYAMGGKPLSGLNIIGFPRGLFPMEMLAEILQGGSAKAAEAGMPIIGGHSIADDELKYGMAVTGTIHPDKILTNAGAKPGDVLLLTKPIGTGTITTALKAGKGTAEMETLVCAIMARLNRDAAEACLRIGVNACTDITGFGLIGHSYELARASKISIRLNYRDIPIIKDAEHTAKSGFVPGGTKANQLWVGSDAVLNSSLGKLERDLLFDPQTSGGLLISVDEPKAMQLIREMQRAGIDARVIGSVGAESPGIIFVD
jgi:selenide, water dikinase